MSKDLKYDPNLTEKLKKFFKNDMKNLVPEPTEFSLSDETTTELGPTSMVSSRIQMMRQILEMMKIKRLQRNETVKVWQLVEDLLHPKTDQNTRCQVLNFLIDVINATDTFEMTRMLAFIHIKDCFKVNVKLEFNLLCAITKDGCMIGGIEDSIQSFILDWLPIILTKSEQPHTDVFKFISNLVKCNAVYLDSEFFMEFLVNQCCHSLCISDFTEQLDACLALLETVITSSYIPHSSIRIVVKALSSYITLPSYVPLLTKIMKQFVNFHVANVIVQEMCYVIEEGENFHIVRGAIYFLYTLFFQKTPVNPVTVNICFTFNSLLKASTSIHPLVVLECAVFVRKMISRHSEMNYSSWDFAIDILNNVYHFLETSDIEVLEDFKTYSKPLLVEILNDIDALISTGLYKGDTTKYFLMVETHNIERPESYAMRLLNHKFHKVLADNSWKNELSQLVHKYLILERRPPVRLQLLHKLKSTFDKLTGFNDEKEELIHDGLQHFDLLTEDGDVEVRVAGINLLVHVILHTHSPSITQPLLSHIEQIALFPFMERENEDRVKKECEDIMCAVKGLILIFKNKLWEDPPTISIAAFNILMTFLEYHYRNSIPMKDLVDIRQLIFEMIFEMRASKKYYLGLPNCPEACMEYQVNPDLDQEVSKYTCFIIVDHKHGSYTGSPAPSTEPGSRPPIKLSLTNAARIVMVALKKETNWPLVKMILEKLPAVLENKALILSKDGTDIDYMANVLCYLASSDDVLKTLQKSNENLIDSDFRNCVYRVMSCLASYHNDLALNYQVNLIKCLQAGLCKRNTSRECASALTLCALEMRTAMTKVLREVMINFSKLSTTPQNAMPFLEFFSTLLHLPKVYYHFKPEQYMAVFAMCIQYTNPFVYNPCVVSLAYHVIAMWFVKCRLPYRKRFVEFISKNLYILAQKYEKPRTSSVAEHHQNTDEMIQFFRDLRETLVDFMSQCCYDSYIFETVRPHEVEMLLKDGKTNSWLLGTRIITITTCGSGKKPFTNGLCDKCLSVCDQNPEGSLIPDESTTHPKDSTRRRHKSEYNRSISSEVSNLPQTKDDLQLDQSRPQLHSFLSQENPKPDHAIPPQKSKSTSDTNALFLDSFSKAKKLPHICACWVKGWAEIHMRQPTGDTSWMVKLVSMPSLTAEDDLVPVLALSDYYSPYGERNKAHFSEDYYESLTHAASTELDFTQASEGYFTTHSSEFSSAQSSEDNSRASSELKLTQEDDCAFAGKLSDKIDQANIGRQRFRSGNAVRRSNSIIGGSEPLSSSRVRHASAAQAQVKSTQSAEVDEDNSFQPIKRGRGHTISEINPASRSVKLSNRRQTLASTSLGSSVADSTLSLDSRSQSSDQGYKLRPTISPSSVFMKFFYQGSFGGGYTRPILIPSQSNELTRSVKLLDYIKPQENHKIGVLYVGPYEKTESEIFKNTCGSERYHKFLEGLGIIYTLSDLPATTYLGGLDRSGEDGKIVYMWREEIMHIVFHVATEFPIVPEDQTFINKKKHIGNNYVTIVYNDSKLRYNTGTIKSDFNHCIIEIIPGDRDTNLVYLHCKLAVGSLLNLQADDPGRLVSDESVPVLARQLAVHANFASMVSESMKDPNSAPYSSNWIERLKKIRKLREKLIGAEQAQAQFAKQQEVCTGSEEYNPFLDFTDLIDVDAEKNRSAHINH